VIIIYIGPLGRLAMQEKIDIHLLTHLVIMHEIGHLISHILFKKLRNSDIKRLSESGFDEAKLSGYMPWNLDNFQGTNKYIHEFLAQMYCRFAIDWSQSFTESFYKLAKKQSPEYQTFQAFADLSMDELFHCNQQLASINRPANPDDVGNILADYIEKSLDDPGSRINRVPYMHFLFNSEQRKKYENLITANKYNII
jgi:hypothetical protein